MLYSTVLGGKILHWTVEQFSFLLLLARVKGLPVSGVIVQLP